MSQSEKNQYEISVNIPLGIADKEGTQNKYTTFKLIDTHDAALTFDHETSGTYAYVLYDGDKEIDPTNYSVTEQTNGFTVSVDSNYIPSLTPGGTLKFVYYMHLNEKQIQPKDFLTKQMSITGIQMIKHHRQSMSLLGQTIC